MPWFRDVPAMGTDNFHQASRRRGPVARGVLRRPTIDPAFAAFREDVARHRDRMTLTPAKIMAYLAQAMDGRIAADAADLPLETLDDFIVFERLPLLRWLGGDIVAGRFEVELLSGERFVSEWLSCHNFRIRRLRAIEGIHA